MYASLKRLILAILPDPVLRSLEPGLRRLYSLAYRGNNVHCPICQNDFSKFIHLNGADLLCPKCGSLSRKRLLWLYLEPRLDPTSNPALLHFSPSKSLGPLLRKRLGPSYITTDYESQLADRNYDITSIEEPNERFDWIICYHVFEHIPDDLAGMRELYRILKPGGKLLTQVPHRETPTVEDPTITDPQERLRLFGQEDHVRYYNREDFVTRLESVGFEVNQEKQAQHFEQGDQQRMGLVPEEIIFVCSKN